MNYRKRAISIILSLIMIMTMIPVMAFAEEDIESVDTASADEITEETVVEDRAEDQPTELLLEETEEELIEKTSEESSDEVVSSDMETVKEDAEEEVNYLDEVEEVDEIIDEEESADPDEDTDVEEGYAEISSEGELNGDEFEGTDPDDLIETFLYDGVEQNDNSTTILRSLSAKGDRLSGNNYKYYTKLKSIMKNVTAAKSSNTYKKMSLGSFLGSRKITASQLGVKRIGYKKNGKWYVSSEAEKALKAYIDPENLSKVTTSLFYDIPEAGYWVDWYNKRQFFSWDCSYTYNSKSLTLSTSSYIIFMVPVSYEFWSGSNWYKVDLSLIKAANKAKSNAKKIVKEFDETVLPTLSELSGAEIDYYRLKYYCDKVDFYTEYDTASWSAVNNNQTIWNNGPWTMITVFDGDSNTNTVCEGYAKAFKYLCDCSTFKSNWIDCQVVSGKADGGEHMWNIVRMNDGRNYLVDPTWTDKGTYADLSKWFLRGAPGGTAKSFTIAGIKRTYDSQTKKVFAAAERKLSTKDYYSPVKSAKISLKKTKITKLTRAKKAFTVKWSKVSTPLKALYIDGYQIQYSLKKNMKGAKTVKVKGYGKTSKKITKLKRYRNYYVRVRTYAKVGKKTYYSKWSAKKKIRTK